MDGMVKCEGAFFGWRVWLALPALQLGTSLSNLDYSFQLPHWQGGVPAALPPGGERAEHRGGVAPPLRLASRRYLAGGVRAARYEKPREGDERVIPERVTYLTRAWRWGCCSLKSWVCPESRVCPVHGNPAPRVM